MIRVLLAEDQGLLRQALAEVLGREEDIEVVAQVGRGDEVLAAALRTRPEVALVDIDMPGRDGLVCTADLREHVPSCRVLVLTVFNRPGYLKRALENGARGYILKDEADRVLLDAVHALSQHKHFFSTRVSEAAVTIDPDSAKSSRFRLTPREREILQLLAEGKSNKEVASLLNISVNTAEAHRANIMLKLDFHSLAELVLYAIRNNIIQT